MSADECSLDWVLKRLRYVGAVDVDVKMDAGLSPKSLKDWENKLSPVAFPNDVKLFYSQSDGLILRYSLSSAHFPHQLFSLKIYSLSQVYVVKVPRRQFRDNAYHNMILDDYSGLVFDENSNSFGATTKVALFCTTVSESDIREDSKSATLDTNNTDVFQQTFQVWFRDNSDEWHFLTSSFMDYFRLMLVHLGVPNWQFAYTIHGLPPLSKYWLSVLSPERLKIDLEIWHNEVLRMTGKTPPRRRRRPQTSTSDLVNDSIHAEGE